MEFKFEAKKARRTIASFVSLLFVIYFISISVHKTEDNVFLSCIFLRPN